MNCKLLGLLTLVVSVAGCASSAPKETAYRPFLIPANAQIVAEGAPPLSAVIGQSGTLYVYDRTTQSLPHSAQLPSSGQSLLFVLSPAALTVRSPEQNATEATTLVNDIDKTHHYALWFVPGEGSSKSIAHASTTQP